MTSPSPSPPSLRILLAEDNAFNEAVATSVLRRQGYEVVVARDGRQAVELASSHSFDLVLMDVQMPLLNGLQATAAIRQRAQVDGAPRVPIVAMTAGDTAEDAEQCLAA